jgi:hypothetical protein
MSKEKNTKDKISDKDETIFNKIIEYAENTVDINIVALTFFNKSIEDLNNFIYRVSLELFKKGKEEYVSLDYPDLSITKSTEKQLELKKIFFNRAKESKHQIDRTFDTNNIACLFKQIDRYRQLEDKIIIQEKIKLELEKEERILSRQSKEELEKSRENLKKHAEWLSLTEYH